MSSFYQDIYTWLQLFPDLTDLFSTRMYPVRLPSNATFPCLTIRRITNPKKYTLDGESNLKEQFYQFTIWDETVKDSSETADTFEQTISGYRGTIGESMAGSVFILNRIDKPDPETSLESQIFDVKFSLQLGKNMENKEEKKKKPVSNKIPNLALPKKDKEEPKKKFVLPYEKKSWRGVKDVFRCKTCDHFEDNEDDMKLHVLKHVPKEEREKLFERLTR